MPPKIQSPANLLSILSKHPSVRDQDELHLISICFKKQLSSLSQRLTGDELIKCAHKLEIWNYDENLIGGKEKEWMHFCWIYVLYGEFWCHEVQYKDGEGLEVFRENTEGLKFTNGAYVVLTNEVLKEVKEETERMERGQNKEFLRSVLFHESKILNKEYHQFWLNVKEKEIKKNAFFNIREYEDSIFMLFKGCSVMTYTEAGRVIKVRELREGSIFSTFLGRYFCKTGADFNKMEKLEYTYEFLEDTVLAIFPADIFYEVKPMRKFKFIVENAWSIYKNRVAETKLMLEKIKALKPAKREVIKTLEDEIENKYIKERCISMPVAIERMKLRNITYSFFEKNKTHRRKVVNFATSQSTQIVDKNCVEVTTNPEKKNISFQSNSEKKGKIKIGDLYKIDISKLGEGSKTERIRIKSEFSDELASPLNSSRVKTEYYVPKKNNHLKESQISDRENALGTTFYQFFRPNEFVSKKLRNHYEFIIESKKKLAIHYEGTEHSENLLKTKNKKEYFEEYVNQRRIMKLGPKNKALLRSKLIY